MIVLATVLVQGWRVVEANSIEFAMKGNLVTSY